MIDEVFFWYDVMFVGEVGGVILEEGLKYMGIDKYELNMIFYFQYMEFDQQLGKEYWDVKFFEFFDLKLVLILW